MALALVRNGAAPSLHTHLFLRHKPGSRAEGESRQGGCEAIGGGDVRVSSCTTFSVPSSQVGTVMFSISRWCCAWAPPLFLSPRGGEGLLGGSLLEVSPLGEHVLATQPLSWAVTPGYLGLGSGGPGLCHLTSVSAREHAGAEAGTGGLAQ